MKTEKQDNKKLLKLFNEDQNERKKCKNSERFWKRLRKRDKNRREIVEEILKNREVKTGGDFYHASMVFQHGENVSDFKKAQTLAFKSMGLNYEKAKWLYAATTDRLLMFQGKKQKFGTQFQFITTLNKIKKNPPKQKWVLYPINKKISDKTRAKYNVELLKKSTKRVREMNQKLKMSSD